LRSAVEGVEDTPSVGSQVLSSEIKQEIGCPRARPELVEGSRF
jgi:hypothetical protein